MTGEPPETLVSPSGVPRRRNGGTTVRSAAFALFSADFRKISGNAVDFSRRGALPNRENVYNEGKFFVFPPLLSVRLLRRAAARESKSGRIEGRR